MMFEPDQMRWVPSLRDIYQFEASRLSRPGSWKTDIRDVLWTFEEFTRELKLDAKQSKDHLDLLEWMVKNRHAMKVGRKEGPPQYLTRVAEIVRLLGHTYEYWHRGRPAIEAVRWLVEFKQVPRREVSASEFQNQLISKVQAEARQDWQRQLELAIRLVVPKAAEAIAASIHKGVGEVRFTRFQLEAVSKMLVSEFGQAKDEPKSQVIVSGVGSGKTYAFMIPALVSAIARLKHGDSDQRVTLLLYPRKALAKNQSEVLYDLYGRLDYPTLKVWFDHADHYKKYGFKSVKHGVEETYGKPFHPPHVVIMTHDTLNRRLRNPAFTTKVPANLSRVVVDEIHLIEGLSGGQVVKVIDRLRNAARLKQGGNRLLWAGASATVARPHVHASTVFGLDVRKIDVIQPAPEEMDPVGLVNHVFLRPSGAISTVGALVNSTSITVHNRRRDLGARKAKKEEAYQKTIGFADNLDLLGRWNADLRENERTEVGDRDHPHDDAKSRWTPRQREVPYATRFHDPLQTRIETEGGSPGGDVFLPVLTEFRGQNLCGGCREAGGRGEQPKSLGPLKKEELDRLAELVYRRPGKDNDEIKMFRIQDPTVFKEGEEAGTLDLCPYLRAGACFWFPEEDEAVEPIPETDHYEWASVARSKIHSAKTTQLSEEQGGGEVVFRAPVEEVYDLRPRKAREIPVDVVLASPSLEVGVDLKNLSESVMYHAIRNVASYRQKVGRVGREEGSDSLNVTLMASRPIDLHYYRQPRKLVSIGQLDPIPLKDDNLSTIKNSLYASVWDWLALEADLPEAVPSTGFTGRLEASLTKLKSSRDIVATYLEWSSRGHVRAGSKEVADAIAQVEEEMGFLLTDTSGIFSGIAKLGDLVPLMAPQQVPKKITMTDEADKMKARLDLLSKEYSDRRKLVDLADTGLEATFRDLDLMAESGWTINVVDPALKTLKDWAVSSGTVTLEMEDVVDSVSRISRHLTTWGKDTLPLYFFTQLDELKGRRDNWKMWYLSDMMSELRVFDLMRKRREYVRLEDLYTSRYEEEVEVVGGGALSGQKVPLREALFSLMPGTWTYRFGRTPIKVKSGRVEPMEGGVLEAGLRQMREAGGLFEKVASKVPGPPGVGDFQVVRPLRLRVGEVKDFKAGAAEKYVRISHTPPRVVLDGDESLARGAEGGPPIQVKIPKSYLNRWVYIDAHDGRPSGVALPDPAFGSLAILGRDGSEEARGEAAIIRIRHPVSAALLTKVEWHERMSVVEFVYSVSRTYTIAGGVDLVFVNENKRPVGLGRKLETEGLSLELDPGLVAEIKGRVEKAILQGSRDWSPSALKALESHLVTEGMKEKTRASPFVVRDFLSIVATSLGRRNEPWTLESMSKEAGALASDPGRLSLLAREYYLLAAEKEKSDEESVLPGETDEKTEEEVAARVGALIQVATLLGPSLPRAASYVGTWTVETLLNSFGVAALNALQRMAGVGDSVAGYAVDFLGIAEGRYRVFLFDMDEKGNGSSEVAHRFLHILHIQRHGTSWDSEFLPTDDFFSSLEEELLQCPQHHADSVALEMYSGGKGIPELGYVRLQAEEVLKTNGKTWEAMRVSGRSDMWMLPILGRQASDVAARSGPSQLAADDVVRATTVCWNGCPECLLNEAQAGGLSGDLTLDKYLLDDWFRLGRSKSMERGSKSYSEVDLRMLGAGELSLPLGRLSSVVLDVHNENLKKRLRSVSLPHTIGLELPRQPKEPVRLLMRTSDIEGLTLFEIPEGQPAMGVEALGFKRLFWNDLIMTCFLDLLGYIPAEMRKVTLSYYDARDVGFADAGVSSRMLDAMVELEPGRSGLKVPEKLSDVLVWMAGRGFKVRLCVETKKLKEKEPRRFAKTLAKGGCEVFEKDVAVGDYQNLMHKKGMVTPLAVIQGSANLTESGAKYNEEIINYAPRASAQYGPLSTAVEDTFKGATPVA